MKSGIEHVGIFVSGICHDGNGEVLFRKRAAGARDEQGKWDPGVGGALDFGETVEACLIREMKEEIGIKPIEFEFLTYMDKFRTMNEVETHWLGLYFKCFIDRKKVVVDERETEEVLWASFNTFPKPMMTGFSETYANFKDIF